MRKKFNTTGNCNPKLHYMVNIEEKLERIQEKVKDGEYFSINRARQYGKTTTLKLLANKLRDDFAVLSVSFEGLADEDYENQGKFCQAFAELLLDSAVYNQITDLSDAAFVRLEEMSRPDFSGATLRSLSGLIAQMCATSKKPVVLMIDEVDQAGNHKLFLDFLGLLRKMYLDRDMRPTFQSVILAGVYDIRNLKLKIRSDTQRQKNSPWNIASDFDIDMSLSRQGIASMLEEYENDCHTGMDIDKLAQLIYEYTEGYPFLVSRICKIIDERIAEGTFSADKYSAWTKAGFLEAVRYLLSEKNTLFESLINKLSDYPELKEMLYKILFAGETITYNIFNPVIDIAIMFGFVRNDNGKLAVSNRIFEILLYNFYTSEEETDSGMFAAGAMDKNQFIKNGMLDMKIICDGKEILEAVV